MELSVAWLLICGVIFVGTVIFREMFLWFRNLIPKSVQCWFCHHKTEVPYTLSNRWHCPKCEQYNGFTADGDYNTVIHQHYEERLNFSVSTLGRKSVWSRNNVLCRDCNKNQELKVQQLASFEPINPRKYDVEVEHFKSQIDKAFKLCPSCEHLVSSVLRKEREDLGVPRHLECRTQKAAKGTWTLFVNLLFSMVLSLIGFIQTRAASSLVALARPTALGFLKSRLPSVYVTARSISPGVIRANVVVLADYVVLFNLVTSLLAYYRSGRQNVALLFNSLMSLVLLGVTVGYDTRVEYLPIIQVSVGISSCVMALYVLKIMYADVREHQRKQQMMLITKPAKPLHCTPSSYYVPTTSTPRSTPPELRTYTYEDAPTVSVKSISPRRSPQLFKSYSYADSTSFISAKSGNSVRNPLRDVGLEPGIQGLNLGSTAKDDDLRSLWNGSAIHNTFSHPNTSSWTAYSGQTQLTTQSAPVGFGGTPLQHIYSPGSVRNLSRPTSPAAIVNHHSLGDYNLRKRNGPGSIISPTSFR